MNAGHRAPILATRNVATLIALMLAALAIALAALALARPLATSNSPVLQAAPRAQVSNPVGDRWWEDLPYSTQTVCCQDQPH